MCHPPRMALLWMAAAAERIGVHRVTPAPVGGSGQGAVLVCRGGQPERRFDGIAQDAFTRDVVLQRPRAEALYVRISGSAEQESSLAAQIARTPGDRVRAGRSWRGSGNAPWALLARDRVQAEVCIHDAGVDGG